MRIITKQRKKETIGVLTREYIDVNDGERVCVYAHNDVHSEQSHSKLRPQLFHHGDHHVVAWGGNSRHRLVQLGGNHSPFISDRNHDAEENNSKLFRNNNVNMIDPN